MVSRAVKTTGGNETGNGRGWRRAKGRKATARRARAPCQSALQRGCEGGVAAVSKLGREVEMAVAALGTVFMTSAAHKEGGREEGREGGRESANGEKGRGEARIIREETIMLRAPAAATVGQLHLKLGRMKLCGQMAKWNKLGGHSRTLGVRAPIRNVRHAPGPGNPHLHCMCTLRSRTKAGFFGLFPSPRLTSFIRHDDDDRFRPVSLRVEHAQGHQVLSVRLQPRQSVLLQRQKQNTWGKWY